MSQDEFTKLFKYIEEFRKDVNKRFDNTDARFDAIDSRFDGLTKLITDYHQEMMMLANKVDRLERWVTQIAEKTGVKLTY